MKRTQGALLTAALVAAAGCCFAQPREGRVLPLVFCCRSDNDLFALLNPQEPLPRYDTPEEAVAQAPEGAGVLVLADGYPDATTRLEPGLFAQARAKRLRLYVEYPDALPGLAVGAPRPTQWERGVVADGFFGEALPARRILQIQGCDFVPLEAPRAHICVARVAGMDEAVYGLPETSFPVLFEHTSGDLMVATTKLSQFVTARYAPQDAWRVIWQRILAWLAPEAEVTLPQWTATVRPSFRLEETLPTNAEARALKRGSAWFLRSGLLADSSTAYEMAKGEDGTPIKPLVGTADGSHGIREGYSSQVNPDGSQPQLPTKRGDCNGEAAMGLAFGGTDAQRGIAGRILDYWYFASISQQGIRADPSHPTFGLASWGISEWAWERAFYGDDNARLMLGTYAASALLGSDRWDDAITRCLLGNLRTTGRLGFRNDRIDIPDLEANGWRRYYEGFTTSYAPHYQAHLWACYLWAYRATGYKPFLERTKTAIRMTMAAYPDQWRWTNGIAQERARMLLPLAWLVRLEDTPKHRLWLRRIAQDLLALQAECGAIREELGPPGSGAYGPPASNEAYGTNEATLIERNGDPVCDLLYTTNFAFIGLHEAAAATGDAYYREAEDKLAKFLCRIQVKAPTHPELDGAWFRAFDFGKWDFWGSNADAGWGVWSIESGWTQGWITGVLGLRQKATSLWELTAGQDLRDDFARLHPLFFPEGDQITNAGIVKHRALGKDVELATQPSPSYFGGGATGLTDGVLGMADHRDAAWLGFEGPDLEAVIDFGEPTAVSTVRAGFLQNVQWGIYLPTRVVAEVSDDGVSFRGIGTVQNPTPQQTEGPFTQRFELNLDAQTTARFLRVHAVSVATIPDWHEARGRKAWLFCDEIMVE